MKKKEEKKTIEMSARIVVIIMILLGLILCAVGIYLPLINYYGAENYYEVSISELLPISLLLWFILTFVGLLVIFLEEKYLIFSALGTLYGFILYRFTFGAGFADLEGFESVYSNGIGFYIIIIGVVIVVFSGIFGFINSFADDFLCC